MRLWVQVLKIVFCRNAIKVCVYNIQSDQILLRTLCARGGYMHQAALKISCTIISIVVDIIKSVVHSICHCLHALDNYRESATHEVAFDKYGYTIDIKGR
jgi:hypothetical protein